MTRARTVSLILSIAVVGLPVCAVAGIGRAMAWW